MPDTERPGNDRVPNDAPGADTVGHVAPIGDRTAGNTVAAAGIAQGPFAADPAPNAVPRAMRRGISLPTRLLALTLLCLLPVIAAVTYTNVELRTERRAEISNLAMRQAELASGDVGSLVGGSNQLLLALARHPAVRALDPAYGGELVALQHDLPEYTFLAVLGTDGTIICSSLPSTPALAAGRHLHWADDVAETGSFAVGRYTTLPGLAPFLPMMQAIQAPQAPGQPARMSGTIVAALDLHWLDQHLSALWRNRAPLQTHSAVTVADRDGTILSRYPGDDGWLGRPLPEAIIPLIGRQAPGVGVLQRADGQDRLAAFVPIAISPVGVATIVVVHGEQLISFLDITGTREILLVAGAALLALLLTSVAGRRFFVQPMERLLQAAQRWRDGDLGARADVGEHSSEFGRLGASFNQMASALEVRDAELRFQAEILEAQVEARTRALSETNNRLQVEIAEREKTEAALSQAQKLQAVGQLAGGIAHDFNNMLATILGSLELMERRLQLGAAGHDKTENERLQNLIARATEAVQRGAQLTSRLLAFSRRQRLAVRPTDLNRLIGDLLSLASSTLGRHVRVRSDLAADLWPALADPSQVEAAILNLCLNARDAMPEGGQLTIATGHETLTAPAADGPAPGDYVRITVTDTGCGMSPEVLAHAFEPFFSTKGPAGSGLGLSQVYGLARQSGGTVRIRSILGQGTEVSLLLPRAQAAAEPADRLRDRDGTRMPAPKLLVLVVDDDAAVRQVTAEMLHDLGCDVIEASCGEDALALLDGAACDVGLLLIDYVMPGLNGIELAQMIRDRGVASPLVLATGYAELGEPAESDASLLDGLLRKPFTIRELQAVVARLRGRAQAHANVIPLRGPLHG